jgi:Fic family protein
MVNRWTKTPAEKLGDLPELNEQEIALKEAENGLLQFDLMHRLIEQAIENGQQPLTPDVIKEFQRLAVVGLEVEAGQFRQGPIGIDGSEHVPPPFEQVPGLLDEMCAYVSAHWRDREPLHLAAYVMWRLNWIHPFSNGNGRTSRVASYLVLCAVLGMDLPGDEAVPDIIDADKARYYFALDEADAAWLDGRLDVSEMEAVIDAALVRQLAQVVS